MDEVTGTESAAPNGATPEGDGISDDELLEGIMEVVLTFEMFKRVREVRNDG